MLYIFILLAIGFKHLFQQRKQLKKSKYQSVSLSVCQSVCLSVCLSVTTTLMLYTGCIAIVQNSSASEKYSSTIRSIFLDDTSQHECPESAQSSLVIIRTFTCNFGWILWIAMKLVSRSKLLTAFAAPKLLSRLVIFIEMKKTNILGMHIWSILFRLKKIKVYSMG